MKPLTVEEVKAIATLQERAGSKFSAIYFTCMGIDIPKAWFMDTFSPERVKKELTIDSKEGQDLHVVKAEIGGLEFETTLSHYDMDEWFDKWEVQANEQND